LKIPDTPPVRCSSCFGQYVERRHVDFEAAWEGPTFKEGIVGEGGEIENGILVSVDDLIICEDCLKAAAALLGLKDPDELAEYAETLEKRVDELLEQVRGYELHTQNLESSIASKRELAEVTG
jgi:hypothetical protein